MTPVHEENTRPAYLDIAGQQWIERQRFLAGATFDCTADYPGVSIQSSLGSGTFLNCFDTVDFSGIDLQYGGYIVLASSVGSLTLSPLNVTGPNTQQWASISGMFVLAGSSADPPDVANAMGRVSRTAQAAAIAATNLTDTTSAGKYEITYYASTTTANPTDGTIALRLHYTDRVGATTQTAPVPLALGAISTGDTAHKGVLVAYLASGNIQYSTVLVGAQTTSRYALEVRCKYLG